MKYIVQSSGTTARSLSFFTLFCLTRGSRDLARVKRHIPSFKGMFEAEENESSMRFSDFWCLLDRVVYGIGLQCSTDGRSH